MGVALHKLPPADCILAVKKAGPGRLPSSDRATRCHTGTAAVFTSDTKHALLTEAFSD